MAGRPMGSVAPFQFRTGFITTPISAADLHALARDAARMMISMPASNEKGESMQMRDMPKWMNVVPVGLGVGLAILGNVHIAVGSLNHPRRLPRRSAGQQEDAP